MYGKERCAWLCTRCLKRLHKEGEVRLASGEVIRSMYSLYIAVSGPAADIILRKGLVPFETCEDAALLWGSPEEAVRFLEHIGHYPYAVVFEVCLMPDFYVLEKKECGEEYRQAGLTCAYFAHGKIPPYLIRVHSVRCL